MNAKLNNQIAEMVKAVGAGSDLETACHYANLSVNETYIWLERGKIESEKIIMGNKADPAEKFYLKVWNDLKKARATAVIRNVTQIQKAGSEGTWQASAWWLERALPEVYGKKNTNNNIISNADRAKELDN